jgi:hypothetical protein
MYDVHAIISIAVVWYTWTVLPYMRRGSLGEYEHQLMWIHVVRITYFDMRSCFSTSHIACMYCLLKQHPECKCTSFEIWNRQGRSTSQSWYRTKHPIIVIVILLGDCIRLTNSYQHITTSQWGTEQKNDELPQRWRERERAQYSNVTCMKGLY